jgi:predicted glycosyltransferase
MLPSEKQLVRRPSPVRRAAGPRPSRRVAFYSHDTVGLGHTRRNLALAAALVNAGEATDVLVLTGNPEAGALPLPDHTDIVTLPTITKDAAGEYQSRVFHSPLSVVVDIRSKVIEAALRAFEPDLLVVDKVPLGVRDELRPSLTWLAGTGRTRVVLGLREILDDPVSAVREWEAMGTTQAIVDFYDEVWVYGDQGVYDLVAEYGLPQAVADRIVYTGYLSEGRTTGLRAPRTGACRPPASPYVLCLVGGGQDGFDLATTFVQTPMPPGQQGVVLTGPFMSAAQRRELDALAAANPDVTVLGFVPNAEEFLSGAGAVVSMAGYNSVCEILATPTPALLVPRVRPRTEQLLRAQRLADQGLTEMVEPDLLQPASLARWLCSAVAGSPQRAVRASSRVDLNGLQLVPALVAALVAGHDRAA